MKKIALIGEPYNGKWIKDSGVVTIRMGIASEWQGNRPSVSAKCGSAYYEPDEQRIRAFWRENVWEGTVVGIVEA